MGISCSTAILNHFIGRTTPAKLVYSYPLLVIAGARLKGHEGRLPHSAQSCRVEIIELDGMNVIAGRADSDVVLPLG